MEKEHFLDLAKNFTSLTPEDTRAVEELQKVYPYSQVIRCLASRGSRDHQLEEAAALLAISAVYAADRAVLKSIMTAPQVHRVNTNMEQEIVAAEPAVTPEPGHIIQHQTLSGDALNEEIMLDLNRLQQLKQDFEESFLEFSKGIKPRVKSTAPEVKPRPDSAQPKKESPSRAAIKSKATDQLTPEPNGESLLQEIAARKLVSPATEKQKEQLKIIDQFISKQPSIVRATPPAAEAPDLADKGADLIDSMVSETLVEILLRQGKKDKAIEVLRKLIWKFPQKKAIFAAQIDELKK